MILEIIFCHLVGDYVLQSDFIAKTKGENWYHLFVHSVLYTLPFYLCFGFHYRLSIILISHFIIDAMKARFKRIDYIEDQVFHYIAAIATYL